MSSSAENPETEVARTGTTDLQLAPAVVYTQPGSKFGSHFRTCSSEASLNSLRTICRVPPEVGLVLPGPDESPETIRPGYYCAYEVYFKGCSLFFLIPEVLLMYLHLLGLGLPQVTLTCFDRF